MEKRFVCIWFRYLKTDWITIQKPELCHKPFVLALPDHGRMIVTAINPVAEAEGIRTGMVLADARALVSTLKYFDDQPNLPKKLLTTIAKNCIRFSPIVGIDLPDGIIMDATGCSHLWGNEEKYLAIIKNRFNHGGYNIHIAMAGTISAAWAIAHFDPSRQIISNSDQLPVLTSLPVASIRLSSEIIERLQKLGLNSVQHLIELPRSALRRRFGNELLKKIDLMFGREQEIIDPVTPVEPYEERLPCLEPIITATGIEIALKTLLDSLCNRLHQEQKGIRNVCFKSYRVDNRIEEISIGTNRATKDAIHLFKLFGEKISEIDPGLGIELFSLTATKLEDVFPQQEKLWEKTCGLNDVKFSELIDRLTNKIGADKIHRFLPDQHYWPERSIKPASLNDKTMAVWGTDKLRPVHLLSNPEPIEVTAPIPDYPPMLFRYKNKLHKIKKADGPERIEQEWWQQEGQHRDYYCVEDENGCRYWLFRSGHYSDENYQWFLHGFFA